MTKHNLSLEERVTKYTKRSESGCLEWTGSINNRGRPNLKYQGKVQLVTRLLWTQKYGKVDTQTYMCHHCDNPKCVEMSHLFAGTHLDNMRDAVKKSRHAFGERNGQAKLNERDVLLIREYCQHFTQREIAKIFGVGKSVIGLISRRKIWTRIESYL